MYTVLKHVNFAHGRRIQGWGQQAQLCTKMRVCGTVEQGRELRLLVVDNSEWSKNASHALDVLICICIIYTYAVH
jgi:hypothetical protein